MIHSHRKQSASFRTNVRLARHLWGGLSNPVASHLRELTERHRLSIAAGDLQLLQGRWYVTHAGLLRIAQRHRCIGIETSLERRLCSPESNRWIFKATVYKDLRSTRGFVGFGDADPSNVSVFVSGAELRIAETRAVNRALRKAYGIGLCSVEELGSSRPSKPSSEPACRDVPLNGGGSTNGQPRLRDQLSLLIRQYDLDPTLVKAYAADFCGTQTLRDASRELIESFISHLAISAKEQRDSLICKLNSYSQTQEAHS
jgi:hypothetical protein